MTTSTSAFQQVHDAITYYLDGHRRQFIEDTFIIVPRDKTKGPVPFKFNRVQNHYWDNRRQHMAIAKARRVTISAIVEADFASAAMLIPNFHALQILQKPLEITITNHMPRIETFISATQKRFRYGSKEEDVWPHLTTNNNQRKVFDWGDTEHGARIESSITVVGSGSLDVIQGGEYDFYHITEIPSYEPEEIESVNKGLLGSPFANVRYESRPERVGDVFHTMYLAAKEGESSYYPLFIPWFWSDDHIKTKDDLWFNAPLELGDDIFPLDPADAAMMELYGLSWDQMRYWLFALAEAQGDRAIRASQMATDDESCWGQAGSPVVPIDVMETLNPTILSPLPKSRYPEQDDLGGKLKLWLLPQENEAYALYADPAEGYSQSHDTAIVIRRARDWALVGLVTGKISPEDTGRILVKLGQKPFFSNALLGWEREPRAAGIRAIVVSEKHYPNVFSPRERVLGHPDKEPGLPMTGATKDGFITAVVDFMKVGEYRCPALALTKQWGALQKVSIVDANDSKITSTYNTARLDLVMADVGCYQMRDQTLRLQRKLGPKREVESSLPDYLMPKKNRDKYLMGG